MVSNRLDLDPGSPLFVGARQRTVVVTSADAADRLGAPFRDVADVVTTPGDRVDVGAAIDELHARGSTRLLCEGGPTLLGQVVTAGRLDELCLTVTPLVALGDAGRIATGAALPDPPRFALASLLEDDGYLFTRWTRRP